MIKVRKRTITAVAGVLGVFLLASILFSLRAPDRTLAAAMGTQASTGNAQQEEHPVGDASGAAANNPHTSFDVHASINSTLLDFQLPGTQPGSLANPLSDSSTCTGCHVDHIRDSYNGSMMTNGVRDPLFRAALVVANKDVGFGGELCIRCHSPNAWLNNRSAVPNDPASTDGRLINAEDLHGISCTACHRMVPPIPMAGEAAVDAAERAALTGPFMSGNSAYIIDRNPTYRGPFDIDSAPHAVANSSFLRSAEMCATCHDIDNPLLTFNEQRGEFELNDLNTPASTTDRLFPLDRSYSEWKASAFANSGVTGLDYPGLKRSNGQPNGPITVCQDCHMPLVSSKIANGGPTRTVGSHQWVGASASWQDGIIQVWDNVGNDTRFDATQTTNSKALALDLLERAAQLDLAVVDGQLEVKITNNTGHKLPTGYAEGRRMWIEVYQLRGSTPVFTSGLMAGVVGLLINDPYLKKYEIKPGLTKAHAEAIGRPELEGESFHIMLNNTVYKDNRIPPRGFTNAAFEARDMQPVGATYADGQYWDTTYYPIHPEADSITVRLMYQTASSEYLDFLATEANFDVDDAVRGTTNWGQIIDTLRSQAQPVGKPVVMVAKKLSFPRYFVAPTGNDTGFCTDSAQPCKTINYALGQAESGGEIRVAAGIYAEQIQLTKPVTLTGGFTLTNWITPTWTTNVTVLDGQQSYRPLTINADGVRVNGFVIRNGNATNMGRSGGGIFIGSVNIVDRAELINLRVEQNVASTIDEGEGGGIAVEMGNTFGITAELTLHNVTVLSNTATTGNLMAQGGGMSLNAAGISVLNVNMLNVIVQGNTAGNEFSSSGGGIAFNLAGGIAKIVQSRIIGNFAAKIDTQSGGPSRGGGIYAVNSNLLLENVLITGNDGERGHALWVQANNNNNVFTTAMNYVTIADNYRWDDSSRSAFYAEGTKIIFTLANTLISGNSIAFETISQNNVQTPEIDFLNVLIDNDVDDINLGTFTINGTPLRGSAGYVNAAARDYHLTADSDAVDAGNDLPPLVDLDGTTRPQGARSDIGAYEFVPLGKQEQTIAFNALPDKLVTDTPFTVNATASSGLPVSFASLTQNVCTVSGNTVTLVDTGTCTIQATQPGNENFNPAPPVARSFAVRSNQKTDQTITFAKPSNKKLGDPPFALNATASSGLPVSFSSNSAGVCTVNGNTVTLVAIGTCSITATQNGNATFNPATPVTQSFTVTTEGGNEEGAIIYIPKVFR